MWMVFNGGGTYWADRMLVLFGSARPAEATSALNGIVCLGTISGNDSESGLYAISFLKDSTIRYSSYAPQQRIQTIADRDVVTPNQPYNFAYAIVNGSVHDIAMTVLPNAPIDPATGLPVPTIAVATDGGTSVIKDNGTVVDITGASYGHGLVKFLGGEKMYLGVRNIGTDGNSLYGVFLDRIPSADTVLDTTNVCNLVTTSSGAGNYVYPDANTYRIPSEGDGSAADAVRTENGTALALTGSLAKVMAEGVAGQTTNQGLSSAVISSDYNTGWMNGDIKLATLSDTDATDVVGTELVTNGTFDSDTGWTKGAGWTISGGTANQDGSNTANSFLQQDVAVVAGKDYIVSVDVAAVAGSSFSITFQTGTAVIASKGSFTNSTSTVKTISRGFTCTSSGDMVFIVNAPAGITSGSLDNITFKIAEPDRSVNGNGLQVFGTVTKTPVATGADLVAYSGFSGSNYLEQPYNSDLDFGTGDFSVMGWVKRTGASDQIVVARCNTGSTNTSGFFQIYDRGTTNNYLRVTFGEAGSATSVVDIDSTKSISERGWVFLTVKRVNSLVSIYINGKLDTSGSVTKNITNVTAVTTVGIRDGGSGPATTASLALLRISATAPSAEQIAKIYQDEKPLFQENAQATLYGTSDAVTALAYDDDTELLHAGTSSGRSVFQGLRRVSNTTDAVTTSISASNSIIVEE